MKFYKHKSFDYFGDYLTEDYLMARNESGKWTSVTKSGELEEFTPKESQSFDNYVADGSWVDAGELVTEEQSKVKF